MAHIHDQPNQHDLTACAFIIRQVDGEWRCLVHMHKKLGKLLQIGGHVELHETPWQSVAHELRESGRDVRTVGFGEAVSTAGVVMLDEVAGAQDDRYGYVNRRAQMYGELALLVTPGDPRERPYALPSTEGACRELHRQLGRVPRLRDGEGRLYLPPKDRRPGDNSKTKTLTELIGRSPDEADAVALMAHALLHPGGLAPAGPAW